MRMPNWLKKTFLFLASILFCFILLELTFRFIGSAPSPTLQHDRSKKFFSPEEARKHPFVRPNTEVINIAVIGDSFTQGAANQKADNFSSRLEYLLNLNDVGQSVAVHNLGRPGTSTFQQGDTLEKALKTNDVIVLQVTLNDTEDWTNPSQVKKWRNAIIPRKPEGIMKLATEHSKLVGVLYGKIAQLKSRKAFIQYYENIYDEEYGGWRRFRKSTARFKAQCDEQNKKFVVMLFPLFSHPLSPERYPFAKQHEMIKEHLNKNEILFIDLYEVFKTMDHYRLEAIPNIDPHPNEIAHRISAEELLEFLIKNDYLSDQFYPKSGAHQGVHEHWQKTYEKMAGLEPTETESSK